ncbi:MAG: nucleotidyltransferase [Microthrixaceae bacterium]
MAVRAGRPDTDMSHHYESGEVPLDETLCDVLSEVATAVDLTGLRALIMGGIGSAALARPRLTDDIDLFVHVDDADELLTYLGDNGFDVERTDARWLYKAFRHGVLTDLIFRSVGDIYLDDEVLRHATTGTYKGVPIRTVSPEDLLVIKSLAASEHRAHHWHDALGIVARSDLDWTYLTERARRFGPRRVMSLLLYAESTDLAVPSPVIESLFRSVHPTQLEMS